MSKYAQALGIIEIPVKTVTFKIKPTKGDNLRFVEIQKASGKDQDKFTREFIKYFATIIAREEGIAIPSKDFEDLETFIEFNADEVVRKVMVAFGWTTEERIKAAEEKVLQGFQIQPAI
jgi:hypothetical protein